MSSGHTCMLLILFHTIIIWTVYANAIIENDRRENMTKSHGRNVYQYFGDSSCQVNIKHYITDAISTVLIGQNRSFENLDEKISALFAKIETLERKMDEKLDRCTSNANKGSSCFGNATCPSGYVYYEPDKFCFKFHNECKSWSEARKVCQQEGGDLIILEEEYFNFFKDVSRSKAGNCNDVWIGAMDISSQGQWYWLNGERVTAIFWAENEPNNSGGNEHCIEMNRLLQYKLNDRTCSDNIHFICQKHVKPLI